MKNTKAFIVRLGLLVSVLFGGTSFALKIPVMLGEGKNGRLLVYFDGQGLLTQKGFDSFSRLQSIDNPWSDAEQVDLVYGEDGRTKSLGFLKKQSLFLFYAPQTVGDLSGNSPAGIVDLSQLGLGGRSIIDFSLAYPIGNRPPSQGAVLARSIQGNELVIFSWENAKRTATLRGNFVAVSYIDNELIAAIENQKVKIISSSLGTTLQELPIFGPEGLVTLRGKLLVFGEKELLLWHRGSITTVKVDGTVDSCSAVLSNKFVCVISRGQGKTLLLEEGDSWRAVYDIAPVPQLDLSKRWLLGPAVDSLVVAAYEDSAPDSRQQRIYLGIWGFDGKPIRLTQLEKSRYGLLSPKNVFLLGLTSAFVKKEAGISSSIFLQGIEGGGYINLFPFGEKRVLVRHTLGNQYQYFLGDTKTSTLSPINLRKVYEQAYRNSSSVRQLNEVSFAPGYDSEARGILVVWGRLPENNRYFISFILLGDEPKVLKEYVVLLGGRDPYPFLGRSQSQGLPVVILHDNRTFYFEVYSGGRLWLDVVELSSGGRREVLYRGELLDRGKVNLSFTDAHPRFIGDELLLVLGLRTLSVDLGTLSVKERGPTLLDRLSTHSAATSLLLAESLVQPTSLLPESNTETTLVYWHWVQEDIYGGKRARDLVLVRLSNEFFDSLDIGALGR